MQRTFFHWFYVNGLFLSPPQSGLFYVNSEEFKYIIIDLYFLLQQSVTVKFNSVTVYYKFIIEQNEIMKRGLVFMQK